MAYDWLPPRPAPRPRASTFQGSSSALTLDRRRNSTPDLSLAPFAERLRPERQAQFAERLRTERQAEIDDWLRRFAEAPGVASSEQDLFSYLVLLSLRNVSPDEDGLDRLRRGNQIARTTREQLSGGRGNVLPDLVGTNLRPFVNVLVARDLAEQMKEGKRLTLTEAVAIVSAAILYLQSGNCGEYATVAAVKGAPLLEPSESICKVDSRLRDHAWSELRADRGRASERDVIVDAWSDGVSPLREHSRFAAKLKSLEVHYSFDKHNGTDLERRTQMRLRQIRDVRKFQGVIAVQRDKYEAELRQRDYRMPSGVWPAMPTLSDKFIAQSAKSAERLESRPNGPLLRQIMAAGAARRLGANVRQAARADELFRPPAPLEKGAREPRDPLRQWLGRRLRYIRHLISSAWQRRFARRRARRNGGA
jgi:hypothetical protein